MDDTSSKGLKTNEQIVKELTKDLESSCVRADDDQHVVSNENVAKSTVSGVESNSFGLDYIEKKSDENDGKYEVDGEHDTNPLNDYVDEDSLKDRELSLSESEKETLKNEAEKHKNKGNDYFKSGEYTQAILMYTQGIQTCPLAYSKERSILYANRAAAKSKCLERESAISDCTKAIELNPSYVKAYVRRGQLYEESEKLDESLEDFKKVLTFDPSHKDANNAVRRLPALIEERNEKLKTEMIGKLKDLGNMVLKPFGLSMNNFELENNPDSGGYSVKFRQSPS
ncbi:Tetratricopeptide repeat protein 1 [Habropoda laboriosa]|uniref:Tetratricopeptide repeat protein 1 n=1 Tax=Habropoda laboriosa TaxID=597456 RepID=A0A0L7RHV7_9HYME|nr:PREDICTED: tetratricopeptide repeat protein 1 [Habropoda laboriosa]KOC70399.1 Tetratricopeptide repeat protein 1 [Habropoda laboriosa]